ncbi:septin-7-like isoform X5 [Brachionus plicatilis]|uniref:Septin-7-like isoform X5 n=1 Tax=Brachionus plicatilis TaxID=10195 RepID=A0A3M7QBV1_BRAPC|nr:septin-7-like isoform X5 [Brachionus plicatilis]
MANISMSSNLPSKTSVTSIVRDSFSSSSNREVPSEKSSLIASLNYNLSHLNASSSSSIGSEATRKDHLYQNISHFKQLQNIIQEKSIIERPLVKPSEIAHDKKPQAPVIPSTPIPTQPPQVPKPSTSHTHSSSISKTKNLDGYVGFANLPNQVYRKSVKKGFEFNLMVIGESGLGKSTFINSLFLAELYNTEDFPNTFERRRKTLFIDSTSVLLNEKGVNLRLSIIDTPGFGESIDNSNCWQPIIDFVDSKYEEFLNAESKINRKLPILDNRVHCCLHFIAPGHTLKTLDIEVMKKLHDRVNLIPVIAKADTMTPEEIKTFKTNVLNVINDHNIQIYEFPDIEDDELENNRSNSALKSKIPFAIVGSNTVIENEGKPFRGRQYPWGCVNVDDLSHCDFMALRTMLIRTHMQDLKDVTNNVHYENYRFKKLAYVTGDKAKPTNKNPFQQLEEERKEAEARLEKMKNEMEGVFDLKVKEKIARLKESEVNLEKQQEAMRISLEKEEKELEERRTVFLREKQIWEESNKEEEDKLRLSLEKEADKKKKKIF